MDIFQLPGLPPAMLTGVVIVAALLVFVGLLLWMSRQTQ
jgi:hypothetical protein